MTHEEAVAKLRALDLEWFLLFPNGEFSIDHAFMPDKWNVLEQVAQIVKEYQMGLVKGQT